MSEGMFSDIAAHVIILVYCIVSFSDKNSIC